MLKTILGFLGLITFAVCLFGLDIKENNICYEQALKWADAHDCECLSDWGSIAFVFTNGDVLGSSVLYEMARNKAKE